MNEIIQGIQVIKMYTWEKSFAKIVDAIRRKETNAIRGTLFIRGTLKSFNLISKVCIFLSLVTYLLYTDEPFTARRVFIVTSYFNYLYGSMLHFWSLSLTNIAETLVSAKRVQTFLMLPETKEELHERREMARQHKKEGKLDEAEDRLLQKANPQIVHTIGNMHKNVGNRLANLNGTDDLHKDINRRSVNDKALKKGVLLEGATAMWWNEDGNQKSIGRLLSQGTLMECPSHALLLLAIGISNVSVSIEPRVLCAVIGPVGAGKSTLLQVILGELQLDDGFLHVNGRISYASQQPWLFEGSVKQNIVFVEPWDEERYVKSELIQYKYKQMCLLWLICRYLKVLKVCALERDLTMMPHADETIVGERGISLSGGQRARVNLARAIYKQADIYLLDDPLSAVDTHVGKYIFENCIKEFLKDKVCVLVTHQLQYLLDVKHALLMNNGRVEIQGTFKELRNNKSFSSLANAIEGAEQQPVDEVRNNLLMDYIKIEIFTISYFFR